MNAARSEPEPSRCAQHKPPQKYLQAPQQRWHDLQGRQKLETALALDLPAHETSPLPCHRGISCDCSSACAGPFTQVRCSLVVHHVLTRCSLDRLSWSTSFNAASSCSLRHRMRSHKLAEAVHVCKNALKLPVCKLARKTSSELQEAAHPTRPFALLPRRGRKRLRSTWISRRRSNLVSRSMNRQTPAAAARVVAPMSAARDLGRDALTGHLRSVHAHLPGHLVCSLATAAGVCRLRPSTPRKGASDSDQNVSRRLRFADMLRNASDLYEQLGLC